MKLYTKTGDDGTTSLVDGTRVKKNHLRIETYGTIDELNSWLGIILNIPNHLQNDMIQNVQNHLFQMGSYLANPTHSKFIIEAPSIDIVSIMEQEIDKMTNTLEPLTNFILSGSSIANAQCHIARTVCRRAERLVISLSEHEPINANIVLILNRLSDYLFTLARYISKINNETEIIWKPSK